MTETGQTRTRRDFLAMATSVAALALGVRGGRARASAPAAPAIRIGVLMGTFGRGSLDERLDAVKANGLDCVQMTMDAAGLSDMPDAIPDAVADRIRRAAADRGITIVSVQGTFNMTHPDPAHRRAGLRRLRVLAEACPRLDTATIHICTGTRDPDSMWRRHPDNDTRDAWRDMVACVRAATDMARQAGVVLAFEPEVNNVVDSAQKARKLIDEIGAPALKVTMDPANIFHAGELPRMREKLDEAFALIGKDSVLAHAKDLDHAGYAGHLPAGQGKLDYDRYIALLHAQHRPIPLLLHGLSASQLPGCVAFLRGKIDRRASRS